MRAATVAVGAVDRLTVLRRAAATAVRAACRALLLAADQTRVFRCSQTSTSTTTNMMQRLQLALQTGSCSSGAEQGARRCATDGCDGKRAATESSAGTPSSTGSRTHSGAAGSAAHDEDGDADEDDGADMDMDVLADSSDDDSDDSDDDGFEVSSGSAGSSSSARSKRKAE